MPLHQASWRDENRGTVLWNLGAFIVGYAVIAALFAASVFASDDGSSRVRYDNPAGGLLETIARPTYHHCLLLRTSLCVIAPIVSHTPISVEYLFSMTFLSGADSRACGDDGIARQCRILQPRPGVRGIRIGATDEPTAARVRQGAHRAGGSRLRCSRAVQFDPILPCLWAVKFE
jgi:hypothetical protein